MKTVLAALLIAASSLAQEVSTNKPATLDVTTPQPRITAPPAATSLGRARPRLFNQEPRYRKSGVLAGWKKGDKPVKILSLRNPPDPERDGENLREDLPTATRRGIKLFSIDF